MNCASEAGGFTVTVPLPPADLSPNARLHWAAKARATRSARKSAWYWFRRFLPLGWVPVPIRLEVRYHCPRSAHGYRPRDVMNAIAALKPMVDGMVDAGVVPDDSAKWVEWGGFALDREKNGDEPGVHVTVVPQSSLQQTGVRRLIPGDQHVERQRDEMDAEGSGKAA